MEYDEKVYIDKIIELLGYKCIGDVPPYELIEHNIPKKFWTTNQLIDYICFLEDNCDC